MASDLKAAIAIQLYVDATTYADNPCLRQQDGEQRRMDIQDKALKCFESDTSHSMLHYFSLADVLEKKVVITDQNGDNRNPVTYGECPEEEIRICLQRDSNFTIRRTLP